MKNILTVFAILWAGHGLSDALAQLPFGGKELARPGTQRHSRGGYQSYEPTSPGSNNNNNNPNVECQRREVGPGRFKFVCDGINKDQITLRNEHILWLTNDATGPQIVDIEVPNYKINEFIKAGYKTTAGGKTLINVLLKRPEQFADAEVDIPKSPLGQTSVNLEYEQSTHQLVHFPNDKQYRPLSGPILPPFSPRY